MHATATITNIVVFGDNSIMTNVLLSRLESCGDVEVKAHVDRQASLWDTLATGHQADAVVISTSDEEASPRVVRMLRTAYSGLQIVVVGDFSEVKQTLRWLEAGAHHVALASDSFDSLLEILRRQRQGECSPAFFQQIAGRINNLRSRQKTKVDLEAVSSDDIVGRETANLLTKREEEVARLIAQGLLNKQIARRLDMRLPTVKSHVTRVLKKLNAGNRREVLGKLSPAWN